MAEQNVLVVACDRRGCGAEIRVPVRPDYWQGDAAQTAINQGWALDLKGRDYCPRHDPTFR